MGMVPSGARAAGGASNVHEQPINVGALQTQNADVRTNGVNTTQIPNLGERDTVAGLPEILVAYTSKTDVGMPNGLCTRFGPR
jgi:hypothetical protein